MKRTLEDMQLDYLDEYLIHFPISLEYVPFEAKYPGWTNMDGKMVLVPNDINKTWAAMEALVDQAWPALSVWAIWSQHLRQVLSIARIRPQRSDRGASAQLSEQAHTVRTRLVSASVASPL